MLKVPQTFYADAWGGPRYDTAMDKWYGSKSEHRKEMKDKGLSEAGDRVHGARNEDHLNLGKGFSYAGQVSRKTRTEGSG
jgi:hypothetical protein